MNLSFLSLPGPKMIGINFKKIFRQALSHRDKANHQRQEKIFQKSFRRQKVGKGIVSRSEEVMR